MSTPETTDPVPSVAPSVLVVDDDDSVRLLLARILASQGWKAVMAGSGEDGVQLFRAMADNIALILLDLHMPGLTGPQTLEQLRSIRSEVPIVLMSGYTAEDLADCPALAEAAGFLEKPFVRQQVVDALLPLLGNRV